MSGIQEGGKKAAETRKEHDQQAHRKMGERSGESSYGSQSDRERSDDNASRRSADQSRRNQDQ